MKEILGETGLMSGLTSCGAMRAGVGRAILRVHFFISSDNLFNAPSPAPPSPPPPPHCAPACSCTAAPKGEWRQTGDPQAAAVCPSPPSCGPSVHSDLTYILAPREGQGWMDHPCLLLSGRRFIGIVARLLGRHHIHLGVRMFIWIFIVTVLQM